MGFFRDLGRRAEKLKSEATDAAEEQADYECADCGKAIFTDRETCPACGSDAVVARTGDDDGDDEELTDDESGDDTATGTAERDDAGTDDP